MPKYILTGAYHCMRCGTQAENKAPVMETEHGYTPVSTRPIVPGWREVIFPTPAGPPLRGDMCPDCVALTVEFISPVQGA